MDGQGTKCRRNIAENYNRLSRVHERYRQTDGRATAYSERKREFTFAKNGKVLLVIIIIRLEATLQPNIGNTLRPVLMMFTPSGITPPKVNRFG